MITSIREMNKAKGTYGGSQCRCKGNITGGGTRAPEARAARGVWGHAPPENFEI